MRPREGHFIPAHESHEDMYSLFEQCVKETEMITLKRNEEGYILAPNGRPSKLNDELLCKVIRTKAFKEWFGDWERLPFLASKAVYEKTGEPRIVFHATMANIPESEGLKSSYSTGEIFFSSDSANAYGWGSKGNSQNKAQIYPCFVKLNTLTGAKGDSYSARRGSRERHFVIRDQNQILHIPLNLVGNIPDVTN